MAVKEEDYYSDVVVKVSSHSSNDLFQVRVSHLPLLCSLLERGFYQFLGNALKWEELRPLVKDYSIFFSSGQRKSSFELKI